MFAQPAPAGVHLAKAQPIRGVLQGQLCKHGLQMDAGGGPGRVELNLRRVECAAGAQGIAPGNEISKVNITTAACKLADREVLAWCTAGNRGSAASSPARRRLPAAGFPPPFGGKRRV
jgi:hypothetical protein